MKRVIYLWFKKVIAAITAAIMSFTGIGGEKEPETELFDQKRGFWMLKTSYRCRWNVYNSVERVENVYFYAGFYSL